MSRIWKFLTSRNTAIVLLIVVSVILLIGAALPNPDLLRPEDLFELESESPFLLTLGKHFNSMEIGRSYAFAFIGLLLIISTTFCSIERVIKRLRARNTGQSELPPAGEHVTVKLHGKPEDIEEKLLSILKKERWKTGVNEAEGGRTITAARGDMGFWGSVFFHGILVTLLAGLAVYYFSAFYATMLFTEGQELRLTKDNLESIQRMPLSLTLPDLSFRFNTFSAEYYDENNATDYTADFDITDLKTGMKSKKIFKINSPFKYKGIDFLMVMQGYSPNFILYENGRQVFDAFVSLEFDHNYRDSFDIKENGLKIVTQFFPDMARNEDGSVYTKTFRPNNPYFGLVIHQNGKQVFKGLVAKGDGAAFGPYRIVFNDLRHWITLNLVRETGIGFFFVCAMIGLAGIVVRMIDPERRIIAHIQGTGEERTVAFYCSAKHFDGMLQEHILEIINQLKLEFVRRQDV
jgi:cytochrome c biogenesis protein ResB